MEENITGVRDLVDTLCFFGICFVMFLVIGVPILTALMKKACTAITGRKRTFMETLLIPLQIIGYFPNLFFRVMLNLRGGNFKKMEEINPLVPLAFAIPMQFLAAGAIGGASLAFYGYAEGGYQREIFEAGGPARARYQNALKESIAMSNKFMNYNQDIQDQYNNDKDKERWEVNPVWYMRDFPEASEELKTLAGENYNRVMEEEKWDMRGGMSDRLAWADQYRIRAERAFRHKFLWSDTYKKNLGDSFKELPQEPSW